MTDEATTRYQLRMHKGVVRVSGRFLVRALGGWGKHKELPRTSPKPSSEYEATPSRHHERSEGPVRGDREV